MLKKESTIRFKGRFHAARHETPQRSFNFGLFFGFCNPDLFSIRTFYCVLFHSILGTSQVGRAAAPSGGVSLHPFGNRLLVPIGRSFQPQPRSVGRVYGTHSHHLQRRERVGGGGTNMTSSCRGGKMGRQSPDESEII